MPDLPERKVGIVACSGEELAEGTVARLAALKVLNELRPRDTVTICLPLFLAGGAGDRAFARVHPTITVDGCDLRCAARATEMYSSKPAASLVVNELVAEQGLNKPEGRRRLNEAGQRTVELTADRLAALVDKALGKEGSAPSADQTSDASAAHRTSEATCSCGSGVPVTKLEIGGQSVELVALPLIFQKFRGADRSLDEPTARELFETVKIYSAVPPEAEAAYREAVLRAYAAYCQSEK
ncbi:MAG: hypothetical protein ABS95_00500 [Verrucomicrobia bacterium SCN 57-15]|nr:MAG: hypothetical protein ABS95_00500 [Verrucomicrobia bacterium SCN 57-15]